MSRVEMGIETFRVGMGVEMMSWVGMGLGMNMTVVMAWVEVSQVGTRVKMDHIARVAVRPPRMCMHTTMLLLLL